jgi:hypothetical protein
MVNLTTGIGEIHGDLEPGIRLITRVAAGSPLKLFCCPHKLSTLAGRCFIQVFPEQRCG